MMFKRVFPGIEISCRALRGVAIQKQGQQYIPVGSNSLSLDAGIITPKITGVNVAQPETFVKHLKDLLAPLVRRDNRIAIALPDGSGKVFLMDIETPFKNRGEGEEIIRWQLKDMLPEGLSNRIKIDFQVLEEKESGLKKVFAAVISQDVLEHYEALIEQAGFAPAIIDFHSLALHNAYRAQIDFSRDFIFIAIAGQQLFAQVFTNQMPVFYRTRAIDTKPQEVFQEVNRSLVGCRAAIPNINRIPVYLHTDWAEREELKHVLEALFEQPVAWLDSSWSRLGNGRRAQTPDNVYSMTAALGMAERLAQGGR